MFGAARLKNFRHDELCLAKILFGPEINSLHTFLSRDICYDWCHVPLRGIMVGLAHPCLQSHRSLLLEKARVLLGTLDPDNQFIESLRTGIRDRRKRRRL